MAVGVPDTVLSSSQGHAWQAYLVPVWFACVSTEAGTCCDLGGQHAPCCVLWQLQAHLVLVYSACLSTDTEACCDLGGQHAPCCVFWHLRCHPCPTRCPGTTLSAGSAVSI